MNTDHPYVSRVVADIKGASIDVELGPKTLIVGAPGSGKSRITDALAIGTGGGYPSVFGRALVAQRQKLALLGIGGEMPDVTLTIKGAPKATLSHGWKVRNLLTGDAVKLRTWAVEVTLDRDFDEELDVAKKNVRDAQQGVRTAEAAAKLGQRAATPPIPKRERDQLEGLGGKLSEALRGLDNYESVEALETDGAAARGALEEAREECNEADEALNAAHAEHFKARKAGGQKAKKQRADAVILIAQVHLHKGLETCLLCGGDVDEELLERRKARMEEIVAEIASSSLSVEQAERQLLQAKRRLPQAESQLAQRARQLERLRALHKQVATVAKRSGSLAEAKEKLCAVREKLSTDDANKRAWTQMQQAGKADAVEAAGLLGEAQAVLKHLKGEIAAAGSQAARILEERAAPYLPEGEELALDLELGVLGLKRTGEEPRYGLSGSQYEQAVIALAGAASAKSKFAQVLVPADVGWRVGPLIDTLEAWSDVPAQIVITSTVEIDDEADLPEGWTLIIIEEGA